ncbi:MAG TPA: single-stranded DNA-binding protein [Planctomycetota bacterium]|nr:single-stranded DNA-binding protein [Planctomycetota bacterium]
MNQLILSGHLTENPVLKPIGPDKLVLNGTLAHNDSYTDKDGTKQEIVVFHDFTAWNGLAKIIAEHITTKRKVLLAGRVRQEHWEQEGEKFRKHVLVVESFEFMDPPPRTLRESNSLH